MGTCDLGKGELGLDLVQGIWWPDRYERLEGETDQCQSCGNGTDRSQLVGAIAEPSRFVD
jgi:hypothetical protein